MNTVEWVLALVIIPLFLAVSSFYLVDWLYWHYTGSSWLQDKWRK